MENKNKILASAHAVDFILLGNGNLKIVVTDKEKFLDMFEHTEPTDDEPGYTFDYVSIFDFLETLKLIGNNWFDLTNTLPLFSGEAIGHDAAYIQDDEDTSDEAESHAEYGYIWGYTDYAILNYMDVLANNGYVIFTNAKA